MAEITVVQVDPQRYTVQVTDEHGATIHTVSVAPADADRLAPGVPPTILIEKSFEFLLEREPKESILRSFDLPVIGRYFPEYEREIGAWLS